MSMRSRIERHEGFVAYHEAVATTRCRQVTAESLAEVFAATRSPSKVVDLGCGDGRSLDLFRRILPDAEWCGLDVEDSPEAVGRRQIGREAWRDRVCQYGWRWGV